MERPKGIDRLHLRSYPEEEEKDSEPPVRLHNPPKIFRETSGDRPPEHVREAKRLADQQHESPKPAKRFSLSAKAKDPEVIVIDDDDDVMQEQDAFSRAIRNVEAVLKEVEQRGVSRKLKKGKLQVGRTRTEPIVVRPFVAKTARMRAEPVDIRALLAKPKQHAPSSPSAEEKFVTLERFMALKQPGPGSPLLFRGLHEAIASVRAQRLPARTRPGAPGEGGGAAGPLAPRTRERGLQSFEPADWPYQVAHLASNYNKSNVRFTYHEGIGRCDCQAPCRVHTCQNASHNFFCTEVSCRFKGKRGNGLSELDGLRIMRIGGTAELTLITRKPIDRGVVIGQYVGEMSLVPSGGGQPEPANEGYRLYLHRDEIHARTERVRINALHGGSHMRFLNHSCDPAACFMEMADGEKRAVVVVTTRAVRADEELSVYYGDKLWFTCRCRNCREAQ